MQIYISYTFVRSFFFYTQAVDFHCIRLWVCISDLVSSLWLARMHTHAHTRPLCLEQSQSIVDNFQTYGVDLTPHIQVTAWLTA